MHIHKLHHLAFGNHIGGVSHDVQNAHFAALDHHLKSAGIQKISHQHTGGVAKQGVGGGFAAPHARVIHHIVVQQGGGMNKLHHRRQLEMVVSPVAQSAGHQ